MPFGACHHQKVLIVDDRLAFCGGGDFGVDRWDSPRHLDRDKRRTMPGGLQHAPRHEVMMMVDGAAARALGDLARERWRTSQECRNLPAPPDVSAADHDPWPTFVPPRFTNARIAIARTEPDWREREGIRETEALHIKAIEQARRTIYLENQYFTSVIVGEALARRLSEPDGPEVVLVSTLHSPSYFDRFTMDRTRWRLVERLKRADVHGRLRAYCPQTSVGHGIIVHSKVTIIDDVLLRVGSTNLNHRSAGFDTECDLAMAADTDAARAGVLEFRAHLLGHFLGVMAPTVQAAVAAADGRLGPAIDALNTADPPRLLPLPRVKMGPMAAVVAAWHLGDPVQPSDSFFPRKRHRRLQPYEAFLDAAAASGEAEVHHQGQVVGG